MNLKTLWIKRMQLLISRLPTCKKATTQRGASPKPSKSKPRQLRKMKI